MIQIEIDTGFNHTGIKHNILLLQSVPKKGRFLGHPVYLAKYEIVREKGGILAKLEKRDRIPPPNPKTTLSSTWFLS